MSGRLRGANKRPRQPPQPPGEVSSVTDNTSIGRSEQSSVRVNHDHDTPSNPVGKINETKRIATDIDTSIPDFLKRKKGDKPKPETPDQKARQS